MAKKKRGQDAAVDMTPMIDCVFLLIIFFVVSTQIVTDVIVLSPPYADHPVTDPIKGDKTIINVNDLGVHIGGTGFPTWQEFKSNLEIIAGRYPRDAAPDNAFSKMVLYIRGDTVTSWKYVQEVLAIANETDPKIYKTDFAVQLKE